LSVKLKINKKRNEPDSCESPNTSDGYRSLINRDSRISNCCSEPIEPIDFFVVVSTSSAKYGKLSKLDGNISSNASPNLAITDFSTELVGTTVTGSFL
jgi:hypothetical protein